MNIRTAHFAAAIMFLAATSSSCLASTVEGASSGIFVDPTPTAGIVTTGLGTSSFTYGQTSGFNNKPNALAFSGNTFSAPYETPFKVGTLTYYNGTINAGTIPDTIDLVLTTSFTAPSIPQVSTSFTLNLVSTPNEDRDPDADADYVYFPSALGSTTFDIGGTLYTLRLVGFENVVGDGFLPSDGTQFHVREAGTASADLYAEFTSQVAAVPELSTWAMMLLGLAGIGFMTYRRHEKRVIARPA